MTAELEVRLQPIRVRLRHPHSCTAALCEVPAAGYVVWVTTGWTELRVNAVCLGHMLWAMGLGGCLVFHARDMPPVDVLADLVQQEIRRRQAMHQPTVSFANYGGVQFTFTATTTGTW